MLSLLPLLSLLGGVAACTAPAAIAQPTAMAAAGDLAQRTWELPGSFEALALMSAATVRYTVVPAASAQSHTLVQVQAPAALMDRISISMEPPSDGLGPGPVLRIGAHGADIANRAVQIAITAPAPQSILLAGAGSLTLSGLASDTLQVQMPGAGHLTLAGRTRSLQVDANGAGTLDASQLIAASVHVRQRGAGTVAVQATGDVQVQSSGAGRTTVAGHPAQRQVELTGSGSVVFP